MSESNAGKVKPSRAQPALFLALAPARVARADIDIVELGPMGTVPPAA